MKIAFDYDAICKNPFVVRKIAESMKDDEKYIFVDQPMSNYKEIVLELSDMGFNEKNFRVILNSNSGNNIMMGSWKRYMSDNYNIMVYFCSTDADSNILSEKCTVLKII